MMTSTLHHSPKIISKDKHGFSKRQLRGLGIVAKGRQISIGTQKGVYHVNSQSRHEDAYTVQIQSMRGKDRWACSCPDFQERGKNCKHIYAVQYWLALPNIAKANGYSSVVQRSVE